MNLLRTLDNPQQRYTLAFLGYGPEAQHSVLELTFNYDISAYEPGPGYGHIAIGVSDIDAVCKQIWQAGGKILQAPHKLENTDEIIAFIQDPDGYQIELVERPPSWF